MEDYCAGNLKNQNPDLSEAFPGSNVSDACANLFLKQDNSEAGDQLTMDGQIQSYIQTNGYPVLYYPYLYEIDKSEKVHAEHSAAGYGNPFQTIIMMTIEDSPSWISEIGVDSDVTVTGWIHIRTWKKTVANILKSKKDKRRPDYDKIYNANYIDEKDIIHAIEPKPKDLVQLMLFGCDREYDRGNKIFEITNKEDEVFSQNMNPALGHYVWRITAKRYRYSFEDGLSKLDAKAADNFYIGDEGEKGNHQVFDNLSVAKMFLGVNDIVGEDADNLLDEPGKDLITEDGITYQRQNHGKVYNEDINKESQKFEFDMNKRVLNYYQDQQEHIHWGGMI